MLAPRVHAFAYLRQVLRHFTEAKELIAGNAIVQVRSKEEAIEKAKRFLRVMGEGESDIRQMHDMPQRYP